MANRQIDPGGPYCRGYDDARLGNAPDCGDLTPADRASYLHGYDAAKFDERDPS